MTNILAIALATSGFGTVLASCLLPEHMPVGSTALFVLLTLAVLTARGVYRVFLWPYLLSPLRSLPTPKAESWWMGHFFQTLALPPGDPQKEFLKMPNTGLVRYLSVWNMERLMPTNARVLQQALTTDAEVWVKPPELSGGWIRLIFGRRSLLFSEGGVHRTARRILNPFFSRKQIRNLVPVFWEKAVYLGHKISEESAKKSGGGGGGGGGGWVEMARWASLSTLDTIGAACLGHDFRATETGGNGSELSKAYSAVFSQTPSANLIHFLALFLPGIIVRNLPVARNRELRDAHRSIVDTCSSLIRQKRAETAQAKTASGEERDILSMMLASGFWDQPGSSGDDGIKDHLMTFLPAGHETTAALVTWALHLLAVYPRYQKTLRDEIRAAFPGGCPASVTYEHVDALKGLRNFMQEVVRYYPPVALTIRVNRKDTVLGGVFVPRGTTMVIVPWALNRDPKIWGEDAHEFRPERWENGDPMSSNYDLLTFLAGPHNCIGKEFARMEYLCLIAVLIGRFEFEGDGKEIVVQGGFTSRPKGGLPMKVREVPGW